MHGALHRALHNEQAEEQRFDAILRSIATTSLRSALVGSVLNAGQARDTYGCRVGYLWLLAGYI